MKKVGIIDYKMGNLLSVARAFEYIGMLPYFTQSPDQFKDADLLVLPGVGAFPEGMAELHRLDIPSGLLDYVKRGRPLLGICLGMQLLFCKSNEFTTTEGIGLINGDVVDIPNKNLSNQNLSVPFIGWTEVQLNPESSSGSLAKLIEKDKSYYFVHSFQARPINKNENIASYEYGGHHICALTGFENIIGCQFHPEKSGEVGLNLLRKISHH